MKKTVKPTIYVATIIDTFNYGTVMQAVATRDVLSNYGYPVFVDYYRPQWTSEGFRRLYLDRAGNSLMNRLKYVAALPSWNYKKKMFRNFIERELELCDVGPYLNGGDFDHDAIYCVGSDQTWNFEDNKGLDPVYFLTNVPCDCRKIAFSASFGRSFLGEEETGPTRDALSSFDAISVRESSSVAILQSLGLDGVALKDPVLLCRPELWRELSHSVSPAKEPYVLVYRLNKGSAMLAYAQHVASELECGVRLVTFRPQEALRVPKGFKTVSQPSPAEWIALFRDASYVVTDSFHGTCFSLLFEQPMTVFDPPKYSVRLIDVLKDFGFSSRRVLNPADVNDIEIHRESVDWDAVRGLKTQFAAEARDFLDGCIGRER